MNNELNTQITEPTSQPTQTPIPTNQIPPSDNNPAEEKPFYHGMDDKKIGYIQNKGWKRPEDAIDSYINLERLKGLDKNNIVELPKEGDEESIKIFRSKIGVPESPDKYELSEAPEGLEVSEELTSWFKNTAHKYGLPKEAAKGLHKEWNELTLKVIKEEQEAIQYKHNQELEEYKKKEGQRFKESEELANRLLRSNGVSKVDVDKIKSILGVGKTLELFANIGRATKEADFISGSGDNGNYAMTPQQALLKRQELISDPKWAEGYKKQQPAKLQEMERLNKIIAGIA